MKILKFTGFFLLTILTIVIYNYNSSGKKKHLNKYDKFKKELLNRSEEEEAKSDSPDKFAEYLMSLKTGEGGETYKGNYQLEELKKAKLRLAKLKPLMLLRENRTGWILRTSGEDICQVLLK